MLRRRLTPITASLYAANIVVQAAGAACIMPEHGMTAPASHSGSSAMAGMSLTSSPMSDASEIPARHDGPCDATGLPGNCASFAPCGTPAMGLDRESPTIPASIHAKPATLVVL